MRKSGHKLLEAPVSWKSLQRIFHQKFGGDEGLDNIAKSLNFNNFQEFYNDVYKRLYKDEGGKKYEPSIVELNKIFKFLLEKPEIYKSIANNISYYGYLRYFGNDEIFDNLTKIKSADDFLVFFRSINPPELGDLARELHEHQRLKKVYEDSNIDIYQVNEFEDLCNVLAKGTTWCVQKTYYYNQYSYGPEGTGSKFFIIVMKREWFNQKKRILKKYALTVSKILLDEEVVSFLKKYRDFSSLIKLHWHKAEKLYLTRLTNIYDYNSSYNINTFMWSLYKAIADPERRRKYDNYWVNNDIQLNGNILKYYSEEYDLRDKSQKADIFDEFTYQIEKILENQRFLYDFVKNKMTDEFIENFMLSVKSHFMYNNDLFAILEDSKVVPKKILYDPVYSEFTNNNQTVKFANFSILPEPYHSLLKNFDIYNIYQLYNKFKTNLDKKCEEPDSGGCPEIDEAYINFIRNNKKRIKKEILTMYEIFYNDFVLPLEVINDRLNDYFNDTYKTLENTIRVSDLEISKLESYKDYLYFVGQGRKDKSNEIKEADFKKYDIYYITSPELDSFVIFKTLNDKNLTSVLNEFEYYLGDFENSAPSNFLKASERKEDLKKYHSFFYNKLKNIDITNIDYITTLNYSMPAHEFKIQGMGSFARALERCYKHKDIVNKLHEIVINPANEIYTVENMYDLRTLVIDLYEIAPPIDIFLASIEKNKTLTEKEIRTLVSIYLLNLYFINNKFSILNNFSSSDLIKKVFKYVSNKSNIFFPEISLRNLNVGLFGNHGDIIKVWEKIKDSGLKFVKNFDKIVDYFNAIKDLNEKFNNIVFVKGDSDFILDATNTFDGIIKKFITTKKDSDNYVISFSGDISFGEETEFINKIIDILIYLRKRDWDLDEYIRQLNLYLQELGEGGAEGLEDLEDLENEDEQ